MARLGIVSVLLGCIAGSTYADPSVRIEGSVVRAGTTTPLSEVELNQPIWLVIRVQDTSPNPQGVAGGRVDITWDGAVLQLLDAIDDTEATVSDVSVLFDSLWTDTELMGGVRVGTSAALSGIRAGQSAQSLQLTLGNSVPFFRLTFLPIAAGDAKITVRGYGFGIIAKGLVSESNHVSVAPTFKVVEPASPSPPSPQPGCGFFPAAMLTGGLFLIGGGRLFTRRRR